MSVPVLAAATAAMDATDLNVGGELVRVIASLGGIIVLILAAGWLSRRVQRRPGSAGPRIRCVETFAVGARDRLLLLDADGTRMLVGIGQNGMRTLHVYGPAPTGGLPIDAAPADVPARGRAPTFGDLLARWTSRT